MPFRRLLEGDFMGGGYGKDRSTVKNKAKIDNN